MCISYVTSFIFHRINIQLTGCTLKKQLIELFGDILGIGNFLANALAFTYYV